MIARIWHGMVPISKAHEYLDLMCRVALPEYLATRGNRGAWCLHRTGADVTHFEMLTFWDDTDAIKRFAGDDFSMAKYYDFDSDYLIEKEAGVRHYEVCSQASSAPLRSERVGLSVDVEESRREKTVAFSKLLYQLPDGQ